VVGIGGPAWLGAPVQIMRTEMAGTVVLAVSEPGMPGRCKTREMLKARVRAELRVYGDAIAVLQKHSIDALSALQDTRDSFKKAHQLAEHARLAYQVSRRKLDDHIASHGCE
jgi:acetyl-CoA carboxylase carboxyltransferase component